ncbi:MAG TPA: cupin domain-containing protein [Tahibacter sp.]|uniref:cupin domain-containing protein n=1 Tax=Tahibacter sp. TaxID=2056211 RepID=UPI002B776659|nr:cupin domain-containing protein [Tahibacter sp.]HSX62733.1 cupin domain-containing protein [Tahibacter sp.]
MLKPDPVDPRALAAGLAELWSPRVIGALDDSYIKVAKVRGELVWHSHDAQDELFFVLQGRLRLRLPDRDVELGPGELFVVPRGVQHLPIADEECLLLLIENKDTAHTGDVVSERTRSIEEQLRDA